MGLLSLLSCAPRTNVFAQERPEGGRDYEDGPLTAEDFQAPIPKFADFPGQVAYVETNIWCDYQFRVYHSRHRRMARFTSIKIQALVIPSKSWNRKPTDRRLMDHEQGHFDLTFITILRARRDAAAIKRFVGRGSDDDQAIRDLRHQLDQHLGRLRETLRAANREYDRITQHGAASGPQSEQRLLQKQQIKELTEGSKPESR